MKNYFLLFSAWMLATLLALGFPAQAGFANIAGYLPLLVLAYIFYYSSPWMSLGMASLMVAVDSAYGDSFRALSLFLLLLYGATAFFKRRALRPSLVKKAAWAFLWLSGFQAYLLRHEDLPHGLGGWMGQGGLIALAFVACCVAWWVLEKPAALIEERFFPDPHKDAQLDLFTVRQLKISGKASPLRLQKRIRRRFGLKDTW